MAGVTYINLSKRILKSIILQRPTHLQVLGSHTKTVLKQLEYIGKTYVYYIIISSW